MMNQQEGMSARGSGTINGNRDYCKGVSSRTSKDVLQFSQSKATGQKGVRSGYTAGSMMVVEDEDAV